MNKSQNGSSMTLTPTNNFTKMAIAKTFEFNEPHFIEQLFLPLKKLGVNAFFYSAFLNNQRINCISNHIDWLQYLHDNIHKYKNTFENQFHFRPGFSVDLLNIFPKKEMVIDMFEHDMKNGIYLSHGSKDKKHSEIFIFTTAKLPHSSNQQLLENISKLHQFSLSFKEKAQHLIKRTRLKDIEIQKSNASQFISQSSTETTDEFIEVNRYYLGPQLDDIYLTKTQFFYVKHFLLGKSTKQIAQIYGISSRTVEKQLQLVRQKLGCNSANQLIEVIRYSSLFYSIFFQD